MEGTSSQKFNFSPSFYEKSTHDDQNLHAKIKPILNQIHENRVAVKELQVQYAVNFSDIINSYKNRIQDLKNQYDANEMALMTSTKIFTEKADKLLSNVSTNTLNSEIHSADSA